MSRKTLILLIMLLCLPAIAFAKDDGKIVLLLLKDYNNQFFTDIERGFRDTLPAASNLDLHVRYGAHEGDLSTQRRTIENYLAKYGSALKAVAFTPAASQDELVASVKLLRDNHIAVIILDARIRKEALERAGTDYTLFAGSSNRAGGQEAAKLLSVCAKPNHKVQVLLLNGVQGHEPAAERRAGFRAGLESSGLNYELTERTANWERREAQTAVDALLTMGKRFDLIFAANDLMALGALEALRQLGDVKYHPVVVGFDAIDEARQAVKEGRLYATIAQSPYRMGAVAAQAVTELAAGKLTLPKENLINVEAVRGSQSCS